MNHTRWVNDALKWTLWGFGEEWAEYFGTYYNARYAEYWSGDR